MRRGKIIGKIFGIALVFVMIVGLAGLVTLSSPVLADDPVVTFPDAKLDAAIREAIGKPTGDIYQSDLAGLTNFSASGVSSSVLRGPMGIIKGVRVTMLDLRGLEYCINLVTLDLSHNWISDISPLSSLSNLTTLDLSGNRISDISALSSLTNLTTLDLSYNEISDISALSSLSNLTTLNLRGNQISDISTLVDNIGLNQGDEVYLESNYLDLSPDSQAMNDIQTLQDRGVNVFYEEGGPGIDNIPTIAVPIMGLLIVPIFVIYLLVSLFQLKLHVLIIVIIATAVIIGLVIFFFVRSKRRAS
jgi:hypothetical protein